MLFGHGPIFAISTSRWTRARAVVALGALLCPRRGAPDRDHERDLDWPAGGALAGRRALARVAAYRARHRSGFCPFDSPPGRTSSSRAGQLRRVQVWVGEDTTMFAADRAPRRPEPGAPGETAGARLGALLRGRVGWHQALADGPLGALRFHPFT
jgi:hypothetical protein